MALALAFTIVLLGAGFVVLRPLGLGKGPIALGLAPSAGITLLAIVCSWSVFLRLPPPIAGVLVVGVGVLGWVFIASNRHALRNALSAFAREHRLAAAVFCLSLVVPSVAMGIAFAGVQVPLSPHDGAYHAQVVYAHRLGRPWVDWYPQGMATLFAAPLQLLPWLDTAQGAYELGLSLPLLAVLAVFGLGIAIWRNLAAASLGALFLGLTYQFPYFPQIWSGWPLAMGLVLFIGLWTAALEYLERPGWRWAIVCGLHVGAMILVHGTELYTSAITLLVLAVAYVRRIKWAVLPGHLLIALALAAACAAPYLPTLLGWAGSGAAYGVGVADGQTVEPSQSAPAGLSLFAVFALQSLGIDLPIRLVLLLIGLVVAIQQPAGRALVAIVLAFVAVTCTFTFLHWVPLVQQTYAVTFPWGMHYRLLMLVAIGQSLLAGLGGTMLLRALRERARHWSILAAPTRTARRLRRAGQVLLATWVVLASWAMTAFLRIPVGLVDGYSPDDAVAMAWLQQNVEPGAVVLNDGFADAGIWTPYKAGVPIAIERVVPDDGIRRDVLLANVTRLESIPEARAAACALNVRYLYRGARLSEWDARSFPPLEALRVAPALEEVFRRGDAAVFRLRSECPEARQLNVTAT